MALLGKIRWGIILKGIVFELFAISFSAFLLFLGPMIFPAVVTSLALVLLFLGFCFYLPFFISRRSFPEHTVNALVFFISIPFFSGAIIFIVAAHDVFLTSFNLKEAIGVISGFLPLFYAGTIFYFSSFLYFFCFIKPKISKSI